MNPYDDPIQGEDPGLPPYRNCVQCKQGYAVHVLNKNGMCPRCLMPATESRPNPALPESRSR
jgi:hypothetical protein